MRIAFTSDLHWEPRCAAAIEATAEATARSAPDVLVLAGDLGEPLEHFRRCLRAFYRRTATHLD